MIESYFTKLHKKSQSINYKTQILNIDFIQSKSALLLLLVRKKIFFR